MTYKSFKRVCTNPAMCVRFNGKLLCHLNSCLANTAIDIFSVSHIHTSRCLSGNNYLSMSCKRKFRCFGYLYLTSSAIAAVGKTGFLTC